MGTLTNTTVGYNKYNSLFVSEHSFNKKRM